MDDEELAEWPNFIYFQVERSAGVTTWCDERIEDTDVKYVRVDAIKARLDHWRANTKFIVDEETILIDLEELLTGNFG